MGFLRVLLAVSVFMAHAPQTPFTKIFQGFGGENAVEIFFLISGFYIALILDKTYSSKWGFYKNRFLRLYPIYYMICGLVLLRALLLPSFGNSVTAFPGRALAVGSLANTTLFGSDWLLFLQWRDGALHFGNYHNSTLPLWQMLLVPQAWSIGIEITFYLLAPTLCKAKSSAITVLAFLLIGVRIVALPLGLNLDPWTYRFFPFELPLFLIGILLYRIKKSGKYSFSIDGKLTYLILISLYFIFGLVTESFYIPRWQQLPVLVLVGSAVLLWGAESPRDRKLGNLSYPLYMAHVLIISTYAGTINVLSHRIGALEHLNNPLVAVPITLLISIGFSYLLLRLAQPIERVRDGNRQREALKN